MRLITTLAILGISGCTWVGQDDYDTRLKQLDDDGDGYTRDGGGDDTQVDCDDSNADINPGAEETWYDGIDSDCMEDDDYDKDLDGYRHESSGDSSVDCNDTDAGIFPGATDTWYDNIDSDCAGDDDFDQDGDGKQAGPPDGPGTEDCNDLDATINSDATETWYDGVDQDCDDQNDYDKDGDGYVQPEHVGLTTYWDFENTEVCTGCATGKTSDCDDEDATIYLGAEDTWYDGIDSDCMEDDDYDQDVDGFQDASAGGPVAVQDCDDTDEDVSPDGLEDLVDFRDLDCDGAFDSVRAQDQGMTLVDGHDLRAGEDSTKTYFSVAGAEIDTGTTAYYDTALGFYYSFTAPQDGIQDVTTWLSSLTSDPGAFNLSGGHDVIIDDGEILGATGVLLTGSNRTLGITRYQLDGTGTRESATENLTSVSADFDDIAIGVDDTGVVHAFGCDSSIGRLHYIQASSSSFSTGILTGANNWTSALYSSCDVHFFDGTGAGTLGVTDAATGEYVTFTFDPTSAAPDLTEVTRDATLTPLDLDYPWFASELTEVLADEVNSAVVVIQGSDEALITTGASGPVNTALAVHPTDGTLFITWVNGDGDVGLAYGDVVGGFETATISTQFTALEAVPWVTATGNHVMIGVLGTNELGMAVIAAP
ncbi:MAG: hypothetical protein GY913_28530 [Proteobacteria bacterium]|nr:hypothetical protein [Pseudomonadota bacterium]MCP4920859.1 hypothetical protein [Pseudomonadota bacterium]